MIFPEPTRTRRRTSRRLAVSRLQQPVRSCERSLTTKSLTAMRPSLQPISVPRTSLFEVPVRVGGGLTSKAIAANRGISEQARTDKWVDRQRWMRHSLVAHR